jgi:hypothetical protein
MDGVPASLAAPHPNDDVADFNDQLDVQPADGLSDSSEDSMQEEVLQSDNDDDDAASSHHGGGPMIPVVPKRRSDKISPDRLRYFFWDSECSMREDAGIPPVAAAALDAQEPPQTVDGQRLYHDPLLVMAEIACVPCIDARYGRLSFLVVILLLNNCKL